MKNFFNNLKEKMAQFMQGRHGGDELGMVSLIGALVLSIIASASGFSLLSLLSMALYVYAIFRVFSKDNAKRTEENEKYKAMFSKIKTKIVQFFRRLKNSKEYKYCRCPKCKVLYRVKRGTGEKHIVCKQCKTEFDVKA